MWLVQCMINYNRDLCRKACIQCRCSQEEHVSSSDTEDDLKVGRLLAESRYAHFTTKVKGGDGTRVYKRNRMIVTNPVVSRKDPTFNTVTYNWAPPVLTQKLVREPRRADTTHAEYLWTLQYNLTHLHLVVYYCSVKWKYNVKNQKLRKLKCLRQPASGDVLVFSSCFFRRTNKTSTSDPL